LLLWLWLGLASAWAEPGTVVTFWHAFRGEREDRLRELVQGFERDNPEIRVALQRFTDPRGAGNDYAELYRKLLQAVGEGKPPTVAQMYENWVTQMAEVGQLVPLDKELGATWKDMPSVFLQASTHRDKRRYSVPFNKSLWVLYSNKTLTGGAEPPQNWTDLRTACRALQAQSSQAALGVVSPFELFGMHFVSQGGKFFDPQRRATFAGPVGLGSAAYVQGLFATMLVGEEAYARFSKGQVPYLIDTSAKLTQLENALGEDLRVLPLPRGAGDRIQLTGTQLSVWSKADPRQRRAALRLLRYLTSPEQTRAWAIATGYLPVRGSVYNDSTYAEYLRARPGRAVVAASLSRAQVQPQIVGWEATRVIINDALERMLYQQGQLETELRKAQATSQQLVKGLQGKT
jgi:ABC-type glycerol-3-phosphate transport system substrate-binding protein